jgi:hypothetical protein
MGNDLDETGNFEKVLTKTPAVCRGKFCQALRTWLVSLVLHGYSMVLKDWNGGFLHRLTLSKFTCLICQQ